MNHKLFHRNVSLSFDVDTVDTQWLIHAELYALWAYNLSPFYYHELILVGASINIHIHYKVQGEINYPFPIFNGVLVESWTG